MPQRISLAALSVFAAILLVPSVSLAQGGIRAPIDWHVMDAGKFEVHFPGDSYLQRAKEVAKWAEDAETRLSKDLDHVLVGPVSILIYRSRLEAGQHFGTGDNPGELFPISTEARRRRIVLPMLGSRRSMQRTLEYQLAQIYIDQRWYSADSFKSSVLDFKTDLYPQWIARGIPMRASGPLFPIEEMLVRDSALDGDLPKLSVLHAVDSLNRHHKYPMVVESAMAIDWISKNTPRGSAKRLMHVFDSDLPWPAARLVKRACEMSYTDVEKEFDGYMARKYEAWRSKEEADLYAHRLRSYDQHYRFYELAPAPSPDGRMVAYFEDEKGYFDLVILDLETGEELHPLGIQLHVTIDSVHPNLRGVDWSPDSKAICFAGDHQAQNWLYVQPIDGGPAQSVRLPVDDVVSPQWSPDGKEIVFAGLRRGVQHLYLVDVAAWEVMRLTDTEWSASEPAWSPNGRAVAFVGETDGQTDLWSVDVETRKLSRITDTPVDESSPSFRPDGMALTFTADPGGGLNLFTLDFASGKITRHTDLPGGAISPRWMPDGKEIVFNLFRHGRFTMWAMPPREAPAPVDFTDADRAAAAGRFTLGSVENFQLHDYELSIRFESILPTSAKLSDILGYHNVSSDTQYKFRGGGFDLGFSITYTNRILRPDLFITLAMEIQRDTHKTEKTAGAEVGISYPIDSDTHVALSAFGLKRIRDQASAREDDVQASTFEDGFHFSVSRANVTRRRENPINGYVISSAISWYVPALGSDVNRITYSAEGRLYVELIHDLVFALRLAGVHSSGPESDKLNLKDAVRGYDSGDPQGTDLVYGNAELRFPIWRDIDYASPGQIMLLKDIRAVVFLDWAVLSEEENVYNMFLYPVRDEWHWGAGFSLQLDLYILERKYFPVLFTFSKALDNTEHAPKGIKFEVAFDLQF